MTNSRLPQLLLVIGAVTMCAIAFVTWRYNLDSGNHVCPPFVTSGTISEPPDHVVEQYKAYVTDLASVGAQFSTTQTFYLTIISALIAILAVKERLQTVNYYLKPVASLVF